MVGRQGKAGLDAGEREPVLTQVRERRRLGEVRGSERRIDAQAGVFIQRRLGVSSQRQQRGALVVVGAVIVGIEHEGAIELNDRFFGLAAFRQHAAAAEPGVGAVRVLGQRLAESLERLLRAVEVLQGEPVMEVGRVGGLGSFRRRAQNRLRLAVAFLGRQQRAENAENAGMARLRPQRRSEPLLRAVAVALTKRLQGRANFEVDGADRGHCRAIRRAENGSKGRAGGESRSAIRVAARIVLGDARPLSPQGGKGRPVF